MTWKQNKNWNPKAQAWKQAWPSEQQEKQKPKKEDKDKTFFVGYDGRKVAVPNGQASSSGSTSSAATAATNAQVLEENRKLRDVFKLLLDKDAGKEVGKDPAELVEECKKIVHNPRESLRERQRELNREKKSINKAEKLESTIREKEENFAKWKAGFMEGLRLEEKRYEEEVKALKEELKNVEDGPETHSMEAESDGEQGARALAEDLTQVKAQIDQMATYFEIMEKRNHQMVQEMNSQAMGEVVEPSHTFLRIGPEETILIPKVAREKPEVDFEAELAIVLARAVTNAPPDAALDAVLGVTGANDVSARRWQGKKGGGQWSRAKSFNTFCPLGPTLIPMGRAKDLLSQGMRVRSWVNGTAMQDGNTSDMEFQLGQILSYLSEGTTLLPGTIILTGTPPGVGYVRDPPVYLQPGDKVEIELEQAGRLSNPVDAS
eukprot:g17588.t1